MRLTGDRWASRKAITSDWSSTTKAGCRLIASGRGHAQFAIVPAIDVQDDLGLGACFVQRGFDAIADDVGVAEWHRRVEDDMELDELREARRSRAQLVYAAHLGMAARDVEDPLSLVVWQLAVHQHVERVAADFPGPVNEIERDQSRHAAVDQRLGAPFGDIDTET